MKPSASKSFLLGAFIFVLAYADQWLNLLGLNNWFVHLGWWLSPWASFPFPYDAGVFSQPAHGLNSSAALLWVLPYVIGTTVLLSLAIAALYLLTFAATTFIHARFGFPSYWQQIRARIDLRAVCTQGAWRAWWVWPAVMMIWVFFQWLDMGLVYANLKFLIFFPWPLVASLVAVALLYARVISRVLRRHVSAVIAAEELRCGQCGYLLRELKADRCPECGRPIPSIGSAEFGLVWERWHRWRVRWGIARVMLLALLVSAPVSVPAALTLVPSPWLRRVPVSVLPPLHILRKPPDPNSFPIRFDAVCEIRHEGSMAILVFDQFGQTTSVDYTAAYWIDSANFGATPPDAVNTGGIVVDRSGSMTIGPWQFSYAHGSDTMLWLTRPDATYEVSAFTRDTYRGDLAWVSD